jgi:hypothetical protein
MSLIARTVALMVRWFIFIEIEFAQPEMSSHFDGQVF